MKYVAWVFLIAIGGWFGYGYLVAGPAAAKAAAQSVLASNAPDQIEGYGSECMYDVMKAQVVTNFDAMNFSGPRAQYAIQAMSFGAFEIPADQMLAQAYATQKGEDFQFTRTSAYVSELMQDLQSAEGADNCLG